MATILKKCQHTPGQRRSCKCNWVVRYRDSAGKQREKSYLWNQKETANKFADDIEHQKRAGDYVDPKQGSERFREAAEKWLADKNCTEATRRNYRHTLDNHLIPAIGNMTLRAVASQQGRDAVKTLLTETLPAKGLGYAGISRACAITKGIVNTAVKEGRIPRSYLTGINIGTESSKAEFVFPTYKQLSTLADHFPAEYRLLVWLMRGCGLRLGEALAVSKPEGGFTTTLRVHEQLSAVTRTYEPLKHRRNGQYRDIPIPSYLMEMLNAAEPVDEARHLFRPRVHATFQRWLSEGRKLAGIADGFTAHSLRHVFASVALSHSVPITDVSKWLGHKDINITYATYGHLVPSSFDRARSVFDAEYADWSNETL